MAVLVDTLVVREALPDEREAVIAVTLAAYEQYNATMPPGAWQQYAESIRDTLADDASGSRIVAAHGAELVGAVLLVPPRLHPVGALPPQPYPEIRLLAVAPQARRRGVAVALLNACIERSRAQGFERIGLHSTKYMADAIRIYERLGFVRAHEYDIETPGGVFVMGFRLSPLPPGPLAVSIP